MTHRIAFSMNHTMLGALASTLLALGGCSASGNPNDATVGYAGGSGGVGGQVPITGGSGESGGGTGPIVLQDGGASALVSAHVERDHVRIELVTLRCAGECADVEAVGRGGRAPYKYAWEDGSTDPKRHLCPSATTSYHVTVTDAGIGSGEFRREPLTAGAPLTAEVLSCPPPPVDGGAGGAPSVGRLCLTNPSFEGPPLRFINQLSVPPWQACVETPDILDQLSIGSAGLSPNDGASYVALAIYSGDNDQWPSESIGQPLCSSLHAGDVVHVKVDVANLRGDLPSTVQFFGSSSACGEAAEQLLGETAPLTDTAPGKWSTRCVTLHAQADVAHLTMRLGFNAGAVNGSYVGIDNLVPVFSCP